MARIHVSDLPGAISISNKEAFDQAVSNSVLRAIDARQQQDIRGGLATPDVLCRIPIIMGIILLPNHLPQL